MTTEESVKLCCQCSIVKWYSGPGEGESPYLDSEHELIGVMGIKYEGDLSSLVKGKRSKINSKGRGPPPPPPSSPPFWDYAHPAFPPECMVKPEYLERESPKVYPRCSGVYPYHPFPMGFAINPSNCRGAPSPPGIPLQRGFRPIPSNYGPGNAASASIPDGVGDFHQGYYTPLPQFIPPSFLPGIHYIPPPLSLNVLAETTKEAHATEADSQDSGVVHEPGQPSSSPEETTRDQSVYSNE
nr:PREDICTED: doublesex- and mab-3-related transcription factor B1 [Opisthocomus hoazin]